jgi:hypothetical protein
MKNILLNFFLQFILVLQVFLYFSSDLDCKYTRPAYTLV